MKTTHCQVQRPRATCRRRGRLLVGARRSSVPPIRAGPAEERGRALQERAGPETCPSPNPRVAAPTPPRHLGETGREREGRGEAGGGARPVGANPPGGARGRGRGHRARPKHTGSGAPWGRAAPPPSGARAAVPPCPLSTPPAFVVQTLPPGSSSSGGARWRLPGSARCPSLSSCVLPSRATRFSSFSVNNSWVAGGGGKVAPAESGRAPPTHPWAAVGAGGWRR